MNRLFLPLIFLLLAACAWVSLRGQAHPRGVRPAPGTPAAAEAGAPLPPVPPRRIEANAPVAGSGSTTSTGAATEGVCVLDAAGHPIADARVRAAVSRDQFRTFEIQEAQCGPDGRFALPWPADAWVLFDVHADGKAPAVVSLTAPDEGIQAVSLEDGILFDGTLTGPDGKPLARTRVRLEPDVTETSLTNQVLSRMHPVDAEVTTDDVGGFSVDSLREASYRVVLPDRPDAPAILLSAEKVRSGHLVLRAAR